MAEERRARVSLLLEAARLLSDSASAEGAALRRHLRDTTGLSAQNIEAGLSRCLEGAPSPAELDSLLASTPEAPSAHVLLSANVFVAALRALAIAVASSARVRARASRREPALAEALHRLAPELFELVPLLAPEPGDHLWAYGSDETLRAVRAELPPGVYFHAHGSGFGAVVVEGKSFDGAAARRVAWDTVLFDQRGCLSPRVVCVLGSPEEARAVSRLLAAQLAELAEEVPPGAMSREEEGEARRQRDAAAYAFELFDAGPGWVTLGEYFALPPAGRNLHVVTGPAPVPTLAPWSTHLTCISTDGALDPLLRSAFPGARVVPLGRMQAPPLDGPVDLRRGSRGEPV